MKLYKLTDQDRYTRNNTQWGENVTHTAYGVNPNLCSDGWIHAYENPIIAVLMNPLHANIKNPLMFESEGGGEFISDKLKCGVKTLTTIREIPLPTITGEQYIRFAIGSSWKLSSAEWKMWATKWLSGEDRSSDAAYAAYADYATYTASTASAYAASAAAYTAYTAYAAASATYTASAASAAYTADKSIDFIRIAKWAITNQTIEELLCQTV